MDCVELIRAARNKGLALEVVDDVLKVRGPKKFSVLVAQLIARKAEVLSILAVAQPAASRFDIQIGGDGDETIETPAANRVSSPTRVEIGSGRNADCGPLHVRPGNWRHTGSRATCPNCGRFLGYVRTNGGQDGTEA